MDLGALRAMVIDLNFGIQGIPGTVTRPFPDDTPIDTRVLWCTPNTEDALSGFEMQRREPKRVIALRRDEVPTYPRGTLILAPERAGEEIKRWRVDGTERVETLHARVTVIPDPDPYA